MKRKHAILTLAILLLIASGYLCFANRLNMAESYQEIHPGMLHDSVEMVLGSSRTRNEFLRWLDHRSLVDVTGNNLLNDLRPEVAYWYSDNGAIVVRFDSDNRVADKELLGITVSTPRHTLNRAQEWWESSGTVQQKFLQLWRWMGR
jgi:hypothetical protein